MSVFREDFISTCIDKIIIDHGKDVIVLKGKDVTVKQICDSVIVHGTGEFDPNCEIYVFLKDRCVNSTNVIEMKLDMVRATDQVKSHIGDVDVETVTKCAIEIFIDECMTRVFVTCDFKAMCGSFIGVLYELDNYISVVFKSIKEVDPINRCNHQILTLMDIDLCDSKDNTCDEEIEYVFMLNPIFFVYGSNDTIVIKRYGMKKKLLQMIKEFRDDTVVRMPYDKIRKMFY
jgi:hypothetical protein